MMYIGKRNDETEKGGVSTPRTQKLEKLSLQRDTLLWLEIPGVCT